MTRDKILLSRLLGMPTHASSHLASGCGIEETDIEKNVKKVPHDVGSTRVHRRGAMRLPECACPNRASSFHWSGVVISSSLIQLRQHASLRTHVRPTRPVFPTRSPLDQPVPLPPRPGVGRTQAGRRDLDSSIATFLGGIECSATPAWTRVARRHCAIGDGATRRTWTRQASESGVQRGGMDEEEG